MIQIDINEVLALKARLKEINKNELEDVVLVKDGVEIPVSQEAKDLWKFSGLLLSDYVLMLDEKNQLEIIVNSFPQL
jgi:hypothetical protein